MRKIMNQLIKHHKGIYLDINKHGEPYLSFVNPKLIKLLSLDELSYVQPRLMAIEADIMMNSSIKTVVERTLPFVKDCDEALLVNTLKKEFAERSNVENVDTYLSTLIDAHFNNSEPIEDICLLGYSVNDEKPSGLAYLNGIYYHGELEGKIGFDMVFIDQIVDYIHLLLVGDTNVIGIKVRNMTTGEIYDAYMTYWKNSLRMRGYVYLQNDIEAYQTAQQNYALRAEHI